MADYEIIEADFQQYYNLDIASLKFCRYARLLMNLPIESRFVQKYLPSKDWDWDKEVQSRILQMLDIISCHLVNMHRKKGTKAIKPNEQFQPDYVREAKNMAKENKRETAKTEQEDLAAIFEARNNNINRLDGVANGA